MRNILLMSSVLAVLAPYGAFAQTDTAGVSARIQKLEEELALLKRQLEVKEEKEKAVAEKAASVEYGPKGLQITSPDKRYGLKLRGYAQADSRSFVDNSNTSNVDQFLIRSARPIIEANFDKDFSARLMLDFGGGSSRLLDAYMDYKPLSYANFRLGKFKAPIGLERWQSEQEIVFVERGMATNLVPFRDVGVQLSGEVIPQQLEYQLAFTNGAVDIGDPSGDVDDGKDVTARIFAHPFRNAETVALQGIGLGVAGSYGERDGSTTNTNLVSGYRSPAQANIFSYRTDSYADGTLWRINPQGYYYVGPFGVLAEYVMTGQDVHRGTAQDTLHHDGYTVYASYLLTGEDASFEGVKPKNPFDLKGGGYGAWELTARYGELTLDKDAFPVFADAARSVREASEGTLGLNWHVNYNLKFNFNYAYTTFDGGAAAGADREDEKLFTTRAQFRF